LNDLRDVRFCTAPTGARIAYACAGRGPALLMPAAWISHLELLWQDLAYRAFVAPLAAARTVVQYDRPGCGLSEPWPARQDLDSDLVVLEAVANHLGLERFDVLGVSLGAPASIAFAARRPERVDRLMLYGGFANGRSIASPAVRAAMLDLIRAHWGPGSEVLADIFLPEGSAESKALFARLRRRRLQTPQPRCSRIASCAPAAGTPSWNTSPPRRAPRCVACSMPSAGRGAVSSKAAPASETCAP
jgi:pimeloyl-ACP methyl ester carboxylesterase